MATTPPPPHCFSAAASAARQAMTARGKQSATTLPLLAGGAATLVAPLALLAAFDEQWRSIHPRPFWEEEEATCGWEDGPKLLHRATHVEAVET